MSDRPTGQPAWIPCDDCADFVCTIHGGHVFECVCPPIEEWGCDPYSEGGRRPAGRPRIDDKRSPRGGFNDAEWAKVKAAAKADGMTASAWVRARCGL